MKKAAISESMIQIHIEKLSMKPILKLLLLQLKSFRFRFFSSSWLEKKMSALAERSVTEINVENGKYDIAEIKRIY